MITRRGVFALLAVTGVVAACVPPKPPPPPPLPPVPVPCSAGPGSQVPGNDPLRSGWFPDQPGLDPSVGGACEFGELWAAPVVGQVYARPIVDPGVGANGTLVVADETNVIYGFDAVTGEQLWARFLGFPWNASDIGCADLSPTVGITSTPAIDAATHTAYMTSKTYDGNGVAIYRAHAIDIATGNEKPNFPVTIQGNAANSPLTSFAAKNHLQRPGLLLMGGVVYAAFGGLCDTSPYRGWVAGINANTGAITTLWTDEALVPDPNPPEFGRPGGGIWQAGGHLVNDNGDILLMSGNGDVSPIPVPGSTPPTQLGEAAIRLKVLPTGHLQAVDFFAPCNSEQLSAEDLDFGTGAPAVLPDSFGTNPRLVIAFGKEGTLYLLNRADFGGYQQGAAGSCPDGSDNAGDDVVSKFRLNDGLFGFWATPGVWPGDGGLIYVPYQAAFGGSGKFTAYRVTPDGNGTPSLSVAGRSNDELYGFGTSSAIITSDGTTSGTALVWLVRLPDGTGVGAELRAYDANPVGGVLNLRGRWPIGQGTKFNTPTVHDGRMYVGAQDGFIHAFGALPQGTAAQTPPPPRGASTNQLPDSES